MIVTADSLKILLETKPEIRQHIIGRALVVLFQRQTEHERSANTTNVTNGVGFAGMDARSGCLTAKTYIKYNTLQDWQVNNWMKPSKNGYPRICKYWRQLNEAAEQKAAQKAA